MKRKIETEKRRVEDIFVKLHEIAAQVCPHAEVALWEACQSLKEAAHHLFVAQVATGE